MSEEDSVLESLPNALGAEKSVLSSILQDPIKFIDRALEFKISYKTFYYPAHQTLFKHLLELYNENKEIELVALVQSLQDNFIIDHVGGAAAIYDIYTYSPSSGHFNNHCKIIKSKETLRLTLEFAEQLIEDAKSNPENPDDLLVSAENKISQLRSEEANEADATSKQIVGQSIAQLERLLGKAGETVGIKTGFSLLDKMTSGMKPGEMFVIAARPSMGKTSFMVNIIESVCIDQSKPVGVFSCEMSKLQVIDRLLYSRAKYAISNIGLGYVPDKGDLQRIQRVALEIADAGLHINDDIIDIQAIKSKAKRWKKEFDIQLLAIDYLQLLKSKSKQAQNNREREISEISSSIKSLAKELGIPIVILAQLNRGPEGRSGGSVGIPRLSDLRESGSIEQDADMVGLLYRSAYYATSQEDKAKEAGKAELILAKNRNGQTGHVPLIFNDAIMKFETFKREATT